MFVKNRFEGFGARGVCRSIRREVEEPLAGMILPGKLKKGESFRFTI